MTGEIRLTPIAIRAGVWEGLLQGLPGQVPQVEVSLRGQSIPGAEVKPLVDRADHYALQIPIPVARLDEGVQTFLIQSCGQVLAHFTVVTGMALDADLRAELDLLRAELDLLKRAFRRHCVETAGG